MIDLKKIDSMSDDARRVFLPFNLGDEIYPAKNFSSESLFGAAHTGELKGIKDPVTVRVIQREVPLKSKRPQDVDQAASL